MAKKKKHSKKKFKRKQNVANITTKPQKTLVEEKPVLAKKTLAGSKQAKTATESRVESAEIRDVRFSLVLAGVIVLVFGVVYVVLQNQAVSDTIYGIIKISN